MRVLVTDSDNRSALAAVRSLGRSGHVVVAAGERHPSLASVSRYAAAFQPYPSPVKDPEGFVSAVIEATQRLNIDILMPMTEISTLLLTEHQQRLPAHVHLPFPTAEAVATAADKSRVLEIATELGVPIPRTRIVRSRQEVHTLRESIAYPVVIKAARSRVWTGSSWISTSVKYAADATMLAEYTASMPESVYPLLLQERIDGPGVGVFLCQDGHGTVASFAHRRLREKPPSGGVSVLCESTAIDADALDYASRLLQRLDWRGVAMVEFKRDLRDGGLRLMEINGRFWGSLQLAIDAGVNFPELLVQIASGRRPPSPPRYEHGIRTRWLWGDVDSLLAVLLRSRQRLNLPPSHPGRLRTLIDFFHLWQPRLRYEIERTDDLRPWLLETRRRFGLH